MSQNRPCAFAAAPTIEYVGMKRPIHDNLVNVCKHSADLGGADFQLDSHLFRHQGSVSLFSLISETLNPLPSNALRRLEVEKVRRKTILVDVRVPNHLFNEGGHKLTKTITFFLHF